MKNSEVKNKHKNKYGKLKTILFIWYFKRKILPHEKIMKQKSRLFTHGGIQKWVVNYWETYALVVNGISERSLLALSSIHEFPSI